MSGFKVSLLVFQKVVHYKLAIDIFLNKFEL